MAKSAEAAVTGDDYAVIRFPSKMRKQDPDTVVVGVNGAKYRMKRNQPVPVPMSVVSVLRNAKEPVVENDLSDNPAAGIQRRKIVDYSQRFPFELMRKITKDVYTAFRDIAMQRPLTENEVYAA